MLRSDWCYWHQSCYPVTLRVLVLVPALVLVLVLVLKQTLVRKCLNSAFSPLFHSSLVDSPSPGQEGPPPLPPSGLVRSKSHLEPVDDPALVAPSPSSHRLSPRSKRSWCSEHHPSNKRLHGNGGQIKVSPFQTGQNKCV